MIFPKSLLFILVFIQWHLIFLRPGTFALSLATVHFQRFKTEVSQKTEYKGSSIISWSKYHLIVNDHWVSSTNRGKRHRSDIIIIIWKEVEASFTTGTKARQSNYISLCCLLPAHFWKCTWYSLFCYEDFFLLWVFFLINCPSFSLHGFNSPAASPFLLGVLLCPTVMNLDNV